MPPKTSCGILLYRKNQKDEYEFFIGHPGGPFWKYKEKGAWSIPKGEIEEGEVDLLNVAKREFEEEMGVKFDKRNLDEFIYLGSVKQSSGKIVHAFAIEDDGEWPGFFLKQHFIDIEFPPKSGKKIKIPEIDKAGFYKEEIAKIKINLAQKDFIDRLKKIQS
ncbi:hypothetical protein COU57_05130 [Candidatus Pacearchaeota archaeon CG10_big_fil_rev_8_21_14_0_10_32_14]|nr:MAG: hypothetical protein COU57_05130 [Candidatus Pacearchaeota archaeon CG10_big_fil_rev_8_21_14_0_10_32_14]